MSSIVEPGDFGHFVDDLAHFHEPQLALGIGRFRQDVGEFLFHLRREDGFGRWIALFAVCRSRIGGGGVDRRRHDGGFGAGLIERPRCDEGEQDETASP